MWLAGLATFLSLPIIIRKWLGTTLKSLSRSYEELDRKDRWKFQAWVILFASITGYLSGNLWCIAGSAHLIVGVGFFPTIYRKHNGKPVHLWIHMSLTLVAVALYYTGMIITAKYAIYLALVNLIGVVSMFIYGNRKHDWIWWLEILTFGLIYIYLFIEKVWPIFI